jgi:hypothetical protein
VQLHLTYVFTGLIAWLFVMAVLVRYALRHHQAARGQGQCRAKQVALIRGDVRSDNYPSTAGMFLSRGIGYVDWTRLVLGCRARFLLDF